jgi:hypothetical protein
MVPRIHRRGSSFKGACGYILHDPGKSSSERVAWIMTQHLHSHPDDAWFEMFDTYRNRSALKANAGIDPRGRDNRTPVLHYTLSWHADDNPDPEHMRAMALASLKALGLSEHEALISAHSDKEHHHVHVVANTVHPYSGRTAPLKFSKLEFSKWAEAYEIEHGIHCVERIKNNERRREIARERETERLTADFALAAGKPPPEKKPFEPVKDASPNRRQWFERKDVIDKMKALRAALDHDQKIERGVTWTRQRQERDQLDKTTKAALDNARAHVKDQLKGQWRDLYREQKRETRDLSRVVTHPLERAVYVFQNRERLGDRDKPLSIRRMIPLIVSRRKLTDRVLQIHDRDRRALARVEKHATKKHTEKIWTAHREKFHTLRERQATERSAERSHQGIEQKDISFARAKAELIREQDRLPAGVPKAEIRPKSALIGQAPLKAGVPVAPKPDRPPPAQAKDALMPNAGVTRDIPKAPTVPVPESREAASPPGAPERKREFKKAPSPDAPQPELPPSEPPGKGKKEWRRKNPGRDFDWER